MKKIDILVFLSFLTVFLGFSLLFFSSQESVAPTQNIEPKEESRETAEQAQEYFISRNTFIEYDINLTALAQDLDLIEEQLYFEITDSEKKQLLSDLQDIEAQLEAENIKTFSSQIDEIYALLYQDQKSEFLEQEFDEEISQEDLVQDDLATDTSEDPIDNNDDDEIYIEKEILALLETIAEEYDVPSWFLKALVRRESSFNTTDISYDDGIEGDDNWNNQRDCAFTEDGYPHGLGLTKLTGWMYQGSPYPFCLEAPDNDYEDWYYAMRMQDFGSWIDMNDLTLLEDPFDPRQNVERFLTGYAVPAYTLFSFQYPDETEEEIWRRVAFHWNKGLYQEYDPENEDYLVLYDQYVEKYQSST